MKREKIYAMHGFLGKASDWDAFPELTPVDLFNYGHELSLQDFARNFNQSLQGSPSILLGYSMGGRLALHALIDAPHKWKAAIIVSANPGLASLSERYERIARDTSLLQRFLTDFDTTLHNWNQQTLFSTTSSFIRTSQDYPPHILKQSLLHWSLGNQENLLTHIAQLPMPILWAAGELDQTYHESALNMKFSHPKSRIWIAEKAAHRIPWELQKEFQNEIEIFINNL